MQIVNVYDFLKACDQTTDQYNVRQAALYIGLQCEELAEKLSALGLGSEAKLLDGLGDLFKKGSLDHHVVGADRAVLLDADMDLAWVSYGAALSLGGDVDKAWRLVNDNNMAKVDPATGKARRNPATGKIMKPEGHKPPDFRSCF